jgi:hypothetical protein
MDAPTEYRKPRIIEVGDLVELTGTGQGNPNGKFGPFCDGQSGLVGNFGSGDDPPCS